MGFCHSQNENRNLLCVYHNGVFVSLIKDKLICKGNNLLVDLVICLPSISDKFKGKGKVEGFIVIRIDISFYYDFIVYSSDKANTEYLEMNENISDTVCSFS